MTPIFLGPSYIIGRYTNYTPNDVQVDSSWWANDGLVSVASAISPTVGSSDKVNKNYSHRNYIGNAQKGVWNYLECIDDVDHLNVVQMYQYRSFVESKYYDLAKMLTSLPQ